MPHHNQASGYAEQKEQGWEPYSRVYHKQHGWVTEDKFKELEDKANWFFDGLNNLAAPAREFIQDRVEDISEIPLVQQTVEAVTPTLQFIGGGVRYSPGPVKTFLDNLEGTKELTRDTLRASGVDPRWGDRGFALAEEAALAGGGRLLKGLSKLPTLRPPRTPQLVPSSGGLHLRFAPDVTPDLSQQVFDITIKNPEFIAPGVREGISTTGKYGKALNKWKARREYLLGELKNPSKQSAKAQKVERSKLANDLSTFNPDEEQLGFWGKGPTSKYLKMVKEQGAIPGQQAHHLFPKNESYAFVKRMAQVGDDDDLVNMFLYTEMLDAKMGGLLDNMLMMDIQPHIGKATTINGKKLEEGLHLQRQRDGREFKHRAAEQMIEFVEEAQTADELMAKFDDYIKNNILQSKSDAIRLQREFEIASRQVKEELTQLTPTLSEAQRRRL